MPSILYKTSKLLFTEVRAILSRGRCSCFLFKIVLLKFPNNIGFCSTLCITGTLGHNLLEFRHQHLQLIVVVSMNSLERKA